MDLNKEKILDNSPLFHLSLGSRELFHSNFLEFVINKDSSFCNKLFKIEGEVEEVLREKYNFDLLIVFKKAIDEKISKGILIENKFKSYPYIEQLERYSKKNNISLSVKDTGFEKKKVKIIKRFLLSPYNDFKVPNGWDSVSYDTYLDELSKLKFEESNHKLEDIKKDYIEFTQCLVNIIKGIPTSVSLANYLDEINIVDSKLKKLRILDIYQKIGYSCLLERIVQGLGTYGESCSLIVGGQDERLKLNKHNLGLKKNISYIRGEPLLEIIIALKKVHYHIQLQGRVLKLMILKKKINKQDEKFMKKNEDILFDFRKYSLTKKLVVYPTSENKDFGEYDTIKSNIRHKAVKLPEHTSIEEIIGFFKEKTKQMKTDEFKKIIGKLDK